MEKKQIKNLIKFEKLFVLFFGFAIVSFITILVLIARFDPDEYTSYTYIFPFLQILAGAITFAGYLLLSKVFEKPFFTKKKNRIINFSLLGISLLFIAIFSYTHVSQSGILPLSDGKACYDLAIAFLNKDYSTIIPKDSYLALWPFQTSFIFTVESKMALFHIVDAGFIEKLNIPYLLLLVASGFGIVNLYSDKPSDSFLYLALMCTDFPLIFRVTRVYGNLPSLAYMMLATFAFVLAYKSEKKKVKAIALILFFVAIILACLYKSTALILVIAFLIIGFSYLLKDKKSAALLAIIAVACILAVSSNKIVQKTYEAKAGSTCGKGVPSVSFIAMGLQDGIEGTNTGGWNGYHSDLYMRMDYDYDETSRISKESIKDSLNSYIHNPKSAARFLYRKTLIHWANQTMRIYEYIDNTWNTSRNPDSFWVKYESGKKYYFNVIADDYHQSIVYLLMLISVILMIVKVINTDDESELCDIIPVVIFIGGFLFSIIWEGQVEANIYYPVIMLPFSIGWFTFLKKEKQE